MSAAPQHWIATDAGSARKGNEDAFVWLGPEDTGGNGTLWVVIDGEGGHSVGNLAAAMVAVTVSELYGSLVVVHRHPVRALEAAVAEADRRLGVIAETYPRLAGVRASYAALAHFEGELYAAVAGSAALFLVTPAGSRRIGESDIARHERSDSDRDLLPGSGLGAGGKLVHTSEGPLDATLTSVALCTDGVTELVPEPLIAQAVTRLAPKDAVAALIEVARRRWSDDDATAAVIRFADPNLQVDTSLKAFLDWSDSGLTKWPDQTLVLQIGRATESEPPPKSNVDGIPPIENEAPAAGADVSVAAGTLVFSEDDVRAIVAASSGRKSVSETRPTDTSGGQKGWETRPSESETSKPAPTVPTPTPTPSLTVESSVPPASGTLFFSPQDVAQVRAAADRAVATPTSDETSPKSLAAQPATTVGPSAKSTAPQHVAPSIDQAFESGSAASVVGKTQDFTPQRPTHDTTGDNVATVQRGQLTDAELVVPSSNRWVPIAVLVAFVLAGVAIWALILR